MPGCRHILRRAAVSGCALALLVPIAAGARPAARDRDRDGMPDRWEKLHRVHAARADADRDGLPNAFEYRARTDPRRRDSDRDHRRDGREDPDRDRLDNAGELLAGTDPRNPDSDGDGILDGFEGRVTLAEPAWDETAEDLADETEAMDGADELGDDDPA